MIITTEQYTRIRTMDRITLKKEGFRKSAVLVPVVTVGDEDHLLLTRRSETLPHHKGQIAFPGGAADDGETPEQTALREAEEEVALCPEKVTLTGMLDDLWTPSEYIITPVVGKVSDISALVPNPAEVDRVFTVPLAFFASGTGMTTKQVRVNGYERTVYFYYYADEEIWGATAFIIRDLLQRIIA